MQGYDKDKEERKAMDEAWAVRHAPSSYYLTYRRNNGCSFSRQRRRRVSVDMSSDEVWNDLLDRIA